MEKSYVTTYVNHEKGFHIGSPYDFLFLRDDEDFHVHHNHIFEVESAFLQV